MKAGNGQNFPPLPPNRPQWRKTVSICNGFFAKRVLLGAGLLQDPEFAFSELAYSFEFSMGVPLPAKAGSTTKVAAIWLGAF